MQKKVHLACGLNVFSGWENYDYNHNKNIKFIDLMKPLDFHENSIDFIYFEHGLEHFDEVDGFNLLKEIYRILKKNAACRIVTPCLDTYINRYLNWNADFNKTHRGQFKNETQFLNYAFYGESEAPDIKFTNNMKSCQIGHKFIYSKTNLTIKCEEIGFKQINFCEYKKSKFKELNNLETRPDYQDIIVELIK